jgi:ribosomal protein L40E
MEGFQTAPAGEEKKRSMMTTIVVIIILLSALMDFTASPGHFEPMVLIVGIVAAAVVYTASSPSLQERLNAPIHLVEEVKRLRQEVAELRQSLGAIRCASCNAALPLGARFCSRCGERQA